MSPPGVLGRVRWNCLHHPGTESSTLVSTDEGWRLSGLMRIRFPEGPTTVRYGIDCAGDWGPRNVEIDLRRGPIHRVLLIQVDEEGRWEVAGFPRRDLRGTQVLDLAASPSTNTIAIRRLALAVGNTKEVSVAWITFPDLEVRPVVQRYTRLTDLRYRYEGLHNGFVAEFDVDSLGFVRDYPEFWERARPSRKRPAGHPARRSRTKAPPR